MDTYKSASMISIDKYGSESMLDFETEDAKFCGASLDDKVIHPKRTSVRLLELVVTITSFCNSLVGAYAVSFCNAGPVVLTLGYFFDLCFLVMIIVKFYVGYYNDNGILVTDRRKIVRRYVRTNFLVDVSSVFPLDFLALLDDDSARALTLLRLNRLLQIYRAMQFFSK